KSHGNWIETEHKHDRDVRCRSLGGERADIIGSKDYIYTTADKISHQSGNSARSATKPMIFDRHVFAFDITGFAQPLPECGRIAGGTLGRSTTDESDRRQRRPLSPGYSRPEGRRAADR